MKCRVLLLAAIGVCLIRVDLLWGQEKGPIRLVFDQAHGEQSPPVQLSALAKKLGLEIQTSTEPITATVLGSVRILYLRAPSREFTSVEAAAIVAFVKAGGSLLLVLDEERRQSLETTRVNDLIN